jgi:hypothetical protein
MPHDLNENMPGEFTALRRVGTIHFYLPHKMFSLMHRSQSKNLFCIYMEM